MPWEARAADFNSDGHPDIAVSHFAGVGRESDVGILFGSANGTLEPQVRFHAGTSPSGIAIGDYQGDGLPDLAVANNYSVEMTLLLSTGPAVPRLGFASDKESLSWPEVIRAMSYNVYRGDLSALADLSGDGLPDAGYGVCQNDSDTSPGGTQDTLFLDTAVPPRRTASSIW